MKNSSRQTGNEFASIDWLHCHYSIKTSQLARLIQSLPIQAGDNVLDLGCGTGYFLDHFSQLVGPTGSVHGIDHDLELLKIAGKRLCHLVNNNWTLSKGDMFSCPDKLGDANRIILFNCLSYIHDVQSALEVIYDQMKPNSILVVKDFDASTSNYIPIDKSLHGGFIECLKCQTELQKENVLNKFVGSSLHGIASEISKGQSRSEIWSFIHAFPFSSAQVEFIRSTFISSLEIIGNECSNQITEYIKSQFTSDDAEFYLNPSSVYIDSEHVVILPK